MKNSAIFIMKLNALGVEKVKVDAIKKTQQLYSWMEIAVLLTLMEMLDVFLMKMLQMMVPVYFKVLIMDWIPDVLKVL